VPRSRLTSKGQITIPAAVREQLQLETGDEVYFDLRPDGTAILRTLRAPAEKLFGMLGTPARSVSIEEMNPGTLDA
jgi:AbrB family looped-hinge helix DNA binding protein